MKRLRALVVLIVLAAGAIAVGNSPASAGADQPRPFRVSVESEFSVVGTCDSGAPLQVITGTGRAQHLGRFDILGQACLDGSPGVVTWTAANGDEITIDFLVEIGPIGPDGSGPISFITLAVSGTGRFANVALGEDDALAGTVWFFDEFGFSGRLEGGIDGTITYDASDRSG